MKVNIIYFSFFFFLFPTVLSFSSSSTTTTRWTGELPWPVTGFSWSLWNCWFAPSTLLAHTGSWASKSTRLPQLRSAPPTTRTALCWTWSSCCPCSCSYVCTWCTEPSSCTVKCCSVPHTGASGRSTTSTSPSALFSRFWWTHTPHARSWSSSSSSG